MTEGGSRRRQRGWVGLVVVLIALVIVALLAQTALKGYGLVPGADQVKRSDRTRLPAAATPAPFDGTGAPPTAGNALERARGVEQQLKRDAQEEQKRIDEATK